MGNELTLEMDHSMLECSRTYTVRLRMSYEQISTIFGNMSRKERELFQFLTTDSAPMSNKLLALAAIALRMEGSHFSEKGSDE